MKDETLKKFIYQNDYRSIIYICARASDFIAKNPDKAFPDDVNELAPGYFDPENMLQLMIVLNVSRDLRSNRETCTCEIPRILAQSVCVNP